MKIGATSDMHGYLPKIPVGLDVLLVAGDLGPATQRYHNNFDYAEKWLRGTFAEWLKSAGCPVIGVAGNHDFIAEHDEELMRSLPWMYLLDEWVEFEGLKFHGSPCTPMFCDWAFMHEDEHLQTYWDQIPADVDVLITHGPAYGVGDTVVGGMRVGSKTLRNHITTLSSLKLHVFGHIHEEAGYNENNKANVSSVNLAYRPTYPVREFVI